MYKPLPRIVYVVREHDGDDDYLLVYESIEGLDNGVIVGTYVINATERLQVKRTLVAEG